MFNNKLFKKQLKNKRAMTAIVIGIVFALVVFVILLIWAVPTLTQSDYLIRKDRCKNSVELLAAGVSIGAKIGEKIECPTEYFTFKGSEETMKREVANQLYDCWDKMGRRNLQLWDDKSDKFCVICSVVEFDGKNDAINNLTRYLAEHKPPQNDNTYFELFNGQSSEDFLNGLQERIDNNQITSEDKLYTSKKYAIVYTFLTEEYLNKMELGGGGAAAGAGAGVGLAALLATPGVNIVTLTAIGIGAGAGFLIGHGAAKTPDWNSYVGIVEYTPEVLDELKCTEIPSPVIARSTTR